VELKTDHMELLNAFFAVGLDTSNPKWLENATKVLDVVPTKGEQPILRRL